MAALRESSGEDSDIDNDLEVDAFEECVSKLEPYIMDKSKVDNFKEILMTLGVKNLSHLQYLQHKDVQNFMTIISYRQMLKKLEKETKEADNSNKENGHYHFNLKDVLGKTFMDSLEKDDIILTKQERKDFIHAVAQDIRIHSPTICDAKVLAESVRIVRKYPTSMGCLMKDDNDIQDAANSLKDSIIYRIRYIIQLEKNKRRNILGENENRKGRRKSDGFSKAQNHGLDPKRDLPSELPLGETKELQEDKRKALVEMDSSGESLNIANIVAIMKATYVSQRIDINSKLDMEGMLKKWPFIGMYPVLEEHFEYLMGIDSVPELVNRFDIKFESVERFFEIEALKKRTGKNVAVSNELKLTVSRYRRIGKEATSCNRFLTIVIGSMNVMKVPLSEVFVLFDDTTSFHQIENHKFKDGRPFVAVLGQNPIENSKAFVVVGNRIISERIISVYNALIAVFMCYFVFKIEYPYEAAPILYFLQSKVFKIHSEGQRTKRKRLQNGKLSSNPPSKPGPYLQYMKNYKDYCLDWNMQAFND